MSNWPNAKMSVVLNHYEWGGCNWKFSPLIWILKARSLHLPPSGIIPELRDEELPQNHRSHFLKVCNNQGGRKWAQKVRPAEKAKILIGRRFWWPNCLTAAWPAWLKIPGDAFGHQSLLPIRNSGRRKISAILTSRLDNFSYAWGTKILIIAKI